MNQYCEHTIKRFYDLFISRQFDQDDLALLFVVTRDYFDKGESIREIGDFIAHPKGKTMGIIYNNINGKVIPQFDKFLDKYKKGKVDETKLSAPELLCSDKSLIEDLIKIFDLVNIKEVKISRENDCFREFVFCLIFLLSNYKLLINKQELEMSVIYSHSLILRALVKSSKSPRTYAQLSVLELHNVWIKCPTTYKPAEHTLKRHIARRFNDGDKSFIAAISFDFDQGKKIYNSKEFKIGQYWGLPVREK